MNDKDGERFASHVKVDETTGCWEWQGSRHNRAGYGWFSFHGKPVYSHRFSYEFFVGPIPKGLVLDHLCCNKCCCNPAHLEPVTAAENTQRYYETVQQ